MDDNQLKSIHIIIPAFNEAERLPDTLEAFLRYYEQAKENFQPSLFVVSDGSTDRTKKIAQEFLSKHKIPGNVFGYETNRGKGYALRHGILNAPKANYYYLADADLSVGWQTINEFMKAALSEKADVVIGSRAMKNSSYPKSSTSSLLRKIARRCSSHFINIFLNLNIKDTQCGYKLISQTCLPTFQKLQINRWGFDFEFLYLIKKRNAKILEYGIAWRHISGGKVRMSAYWQTLFDLLKVRFLSR